MITALLFTMAETSIPLDKATRDRLKDFGKKGETWIELLNRLMDEVDTLNAATTDLCLQQMRGE